VQRPVWWAFAVLTHRVLSEAAISLTRVHREIDSAGTLQALLTVLVKHFAAEIIRQSGEEVWVEVVDGLTGFAVGCYGSAGFVLRVLCLRPCNEVRLCQGGDVATGMSIMTGPSREESAASFAFHGLLRNRRQSANFAW